MNDVIERKRVVPSSLEEVKELCTLEDVMIDLKTCPFDLKVDAIKYALTVDNLTDPLMLLNILNLVKVYNTLDDKYFEAEDVYVNNVEELLDLKLEITNDLKVFTRRLSVYFLSLLKSYNKLSFTPADEHIELPSLYSSIILATDLATMSGVFAKAGTISTDELVYIDNAYVYMTSLVLKSANSANLIDGFYQEMELEIEEVK